MSTWRIQIQRRRKKRRKGKMGRGEGGGRHSTEAGTLNQLYLTGGVGHKAATAQAGAVCQS